MIKKASPSVALIVAADKTGVIGRGGAMPWHLPGDLRYFKKVTMGKPVIMGQKTWRSLKKQPLPGRMNIVLSRRADFAAQGAVLARSLDAAIAMAKQRAAEDGQTEIFIIGGGQVFEQAMPLADRIYWTEIQANIAGDTYFKPKLAGSLWEKTELATPLKLPQDSHDYRFLLYERRAAVTAAAKPALKPKPAKRQTAPAARLPGKANAPGKSGGIFAFLGRFAAVLPRFLQSHR